MNFDESESTPEGRQRLYERAVKWRRANQVRDLWTDKQHDEEAERLAAESTAFKVTKCKPSLAGGWYNHIPDVKHPEFRFPA